ncbi:MAG: TRAP transporter small permease [Clostridia bacterium]|nr:TRAP transporter small permease [Clostridia bacterium]
MSVTSDNTPKQDILDRIADWISRIMIVVCVLLFTVMVFSVSYGVVGRYIPFIRNPRWTQELAILCMVWLCFVSSGYAIKNKLHVRMTILVNLLPEKARGVIGRLVYVLLLAVNVFFVVYGLQLMHLTRRARMSATGWPMKITYLSVVVGGVYGACMSLYRVIKGGN